MPNLTSRNVSASLEPDKKGNLQLPNAKYLLKHGIRTKTAKKMCPDANTVDEGGREGGEEMRRDQMGLG